ncbi:MAG: DNA polymerase Y family protein [Devosia sp.]
MVSTFSPSPIQTELLPQRRYLALYLPLWATDCLKRRDPTLAQSKLPLGLWEKQKGAMRLVALDETAIRHGLSLGQTVSDARAQLPELEVREIDQELTQALFADFADWHSYASPLVVALTDMAPYGDLVLDITGVTHLFSGEEQMLATVTARLKQLGFTAIGAIASTIGAAWALVHSGRSEIVSASLAEALANLPVASLRLADHQIARLTQTGFKTIGQLYSRDRKSLQSRFGDSLLLRLDQALGRLEEPIEPRIPVAELFMERRFADPIGLMDDVLMCAHDLAVSLSCRLEAAGQGAKTFHLFLYRVDHKVMTFSVNAGRATRDPNHIGRLFSYRAERLEGEYDAGFGIDMIRLAASSVCEIDARQIGVFEQDDGAQTLDRLYDLMASRLGPLAVLRPYFVNSYIPERIVNLEPVLIATEPDPDSYPDTATPRPLRLLVTPEPIGVIAEVPDGPPASMVWRRVGYRFIKASGPERIAAEWWSGRQLPALTEASLTLAATEDAAHLYFDEARTIRDYYVAEDNGGRRFWIFRVGLYVADTRPAWFMHGFFA